MNDPIWDEIVNVLSNSPTPMDVLAIRRSSLILRQQNKKELNQILYRKHNNGLIIMSQPNSHGKPVWSLPANANNQNNYNPLINQYNANNNNNNSPQQVRLNDNIMIQNYGNPQNQNYNQNMYNAPYVQQDNSSTVSSIPSIPSSSSSNKTKEKLHDFKNVNPQPLMNEGMLSKYAKFLNTGYDIKWEEFCKLGGDVNKCIDFIQKQTMNKSQIQSNVTRGEYPNENDMNNVSNIGSQFKHVPRHVHPPPPLPRGRGRGRGRGRCAFIKPISQPVPVVKNKNLNKSISHNQPIQPIIQQDISVISSVSNIPSSLGDNLDVNPLHAVIKSNSTNTSNNAYNGNKHVENKSISTKCNDKTHSIKQTSNKIIQLLMNKTSSQKQNMDVITVFGSGDNYASNSSSNQQNTQNNSSSESNQNGHSSNNNNSDNNNQNNGCSGNSGDDDKNNDENNRQNEQKTESNVNVQNEKDNMDRFFKLLSELEHVDDDTLCAELKTFSPNIFSQFANAINGLNVQINRVYSTLSTPAPLLDMNKKKSFAYSSVSESDTDYIDKKPKYNQEEQIVKKFKKKKRYKKSSKTRKMNINKSYKKYEYECEYKDEYVPNCNHEQKIKSYIFTQRWYNAEIIKNMCMHEVADPTDRITLTLEKSKFMRRCEQFTKSLTSTDEINLIPIHMKDNDNNVKIQYLLVVTIDNVRRIDIGISFEYNETYDKTGIIVTGFHLDAECIKLSCPYDVSSSLSNFKINYLNIFGQTEKYYEDRYNKLKSFVQKTMKMKANKFNFNVWIKEAKQLISM